MNFTLEPRKSKKQLQKLISVVEKIEGDKATILLEVYGKKTSVLYDLASITDMMLQNDDKVILLANVLYLSLASIFQNKDNQCSQKDLQVSFNAYWTLALSHLSLKTISSLLLPQRNNHLVVEPLLKCLFIICQSSSNASDACEDLTQVLRDLIAKEQENMNIIKLGVINLVKLRDIYPSFAQ